MATGTAEAGAEGLITTYRELFTMFGTPEEISSDGGSEYTSKKFQDFLKVYDIRHRWSSVYFPQSNGRAEVAVKQMKRLLVQEGLMTAS